MRNIKLYKYIGESSRSMYERGLEHQNDREGLKADSHIKRRRKKDTGQCLDG